MEAWSFAANSKLFLEVKVWGGVSFIKKTVWQLPVGQGLPKLEASEALRISALDYSSWTFVFFIFPFALDRDGTVPKEINFSRYNMKCNAEYFMYSSIIFSIVGHS